MKYVPVPMSMRRRCPKWASPEIACSARAIIKCSAAAAGSEYQLLRNWIGAGAVLLPEEVQEAATETHGSALEALRTAVAWHSSQLSQPQVEQGLTSPLQASVLKLVDSLKKAKRQAGQATGAPKGVVEAIRRTRQTPGHLQCRFADTPVAATAAPRSSGGIREWHPPARKLTVRMSDVLPTRRTKYVPANKNQRTQLATVRAIGPKRAGPRGLFLVGTLYKKLRQWAPFRTGRPRPPVTAIRKAVRWDTAPAVCASSTGHLWQGEAPCDLRQYAYLMGSADMGDAMEAVVRERVVTESQMRTLIGQGTHGAAVALCLARLNERVGGRLCGTLGVTVGSIGHGLGLTALQVIGWLGAGARLVWRQEACPWAGPAGDLLERKLTGAVSHRHERAETAMAAAPWAALEVATLQCQPFSNANPNYPLGVEAALRELHAVIRQIVRRKPDYFVYENTAGLWRCPKLRRRVERLLEGMTGYRWEAMRVSPDRHCAVPSRRWRVFYHAYRKGVLA